jgi:hypothetical protein
MWTHSYGYQFYTNSKESGLSSGRKYHFLGREVSEPAHLESKYAVSLSRARVMQLESATVAGENCTFTFMEPQ